MHAWNAWKGQLTLEVIFPKVSCNECSTFKCAFGVGEIISARQFTEQMDQEITNLLDSSGVASWIKNGFIGRKQGYSHRWDVHRLETKMQCCLAGLNKPIIFMVFMKYSDSKQGPQIIMSMIPKFAVDF